MCSPSPPPQTNFQQSAQDQFGSNLEAARATAQLSNPNITTPFGSRTVNFEGDTPFVTESLSPIGQQQFDTQNRISSQLGQLAESGLGRVSESFGQPFSLEGATPRFDIGSTGGRDQVTNAIIERGLPALQRERSLAENDLLVRGFNPGTEAFNTRADELNRKENDLRLAAILAGGQEQSRQASLQSGLRGRDIQEESFLRNLPLSELNALRSGAQPGLPSFQAFQGANVGAAPVFDASIAQSNAAQQQFQNEIAGSGGLFDLLGAGLGAAGAAGGFGPLFSLGSKAIK